MIRLVAPLALGLAPAAPDELVHWQAPAACPSREALIRAVAADLGRPLTPADAEAVTAHATAQRRPDRRWQLELTLTPRDAPAVARTVVGERCELLVEAAALMIAVAIDPELLAALPRTAPGDRELGDIPLEVPVVRDAPAPASSSTPANTPTLAPAPAIAPILAPAPANSPPPFRRPTPALRGTLAVAAGLDVGALPGPAPGFMVRLGLLARRVRAEVGAVHWLEQSARLAGTASGGDLRLTAAQLLACPRLALRRFEFPVCAGLELGAMRGRGVGVTVPTSDRVVWLALLADARVQYLPVPRLALGLQLGLAAPLLAARFRLRDQDQDLHRAAPVAFRAVFAIELRFP
ncbi:hypothetical protein [Nannocystis bainbridge]|uniref:Uncharacterized protein n=1 Tax=Nannocystis bainbridge TaxID=2995303 RepID=A0ABT5EE27_9BACT|nr:hypothetical protein [Nannocystis bainbridge]MDC0723703.1 hypothetical protein [Nannocystis bainbridge]